MNYTSNFNIFKYADNMDLFKKYNINYINDINDINYISKKCMQHLFFKRRISRFVVSQNILEIAYKSLVERVLTSNGTSWYGT